MGGCEWRSVNNLASGNNSVVGARYIGNQFFGKYSEDPEPDRTKSRFRLPENQPNLQSTAAVNTVLFSLFEM